MALLPSLITASEELKVADIQNLLAAYGDDLPVPSNLGTELLYWSVKWCESQVLAKELNTPLKALAKTDEDFFPNIKEMFWIVCTLSVTSAECERSVSWLRYLKTYLCSTMVEEQLNGLALMYIHRDVTVDMNNVVDEFVRQHKHRLELANPLVDWITYILV